MVSVSSVGHRSRKPSMMTMNAPYWAGRIAAYGPVVAS